MIHPRLAAALAALALGLVAAPKEASAQQYLPTGTFDAASGIEGAQKDFQRARTRLRIGAELRIDESPNDALFGAVVADIEPRSAFGGEIRYMRTITPKFFVNAGAAGYFVPGVLIGPAAGAEFRFPISTKAHVGIGPDFTVFALGGDLPDNIVVWRALLQAGIRVDLF